MKNHNLSSLNKNRGSLLLDILMGIAIVGVLSAVVLGRGERSDSAQLTQRVTDEISTVVAQSRVWKNTRTVYTGIDIEALTDMELLDDTWGDGTGANAAGGDYSVAANAATASRMDIEATDLTQPLCLAVSNQLTSVTFGNVAPACAAGTLTATFR